MAFLGIQDLIECSICLETKQNPKQLTCQHSYCSRCLDQLVNNNSITCPICRQNVTVPAGGVQNLPADFSTNRLMMALSQHNMENVDTCGKCHQNKITHLCKTCSEHLCGVCANIFHSARKKSKNHKLVLLEKCQKHPKKDKLYACTKCQEVICNACVMEDHKTHSMEELSSHFEAKQDLLEELLQNMEAECFQKITEKVPTRVLNDEDDAEEEEDIRKRFASIKRDIQDAAASNIRKTKQEESKLLASLDVDLNYYENWVIEQKNGAMLESEVGSLRISCGPYTDRTIAAGSEMLDSITALTPQVKALTEQIRDASLSPVSSLSLPLSFSATCPEQDFGELVYTADSSEGNAPALNPNLLSTMNLRRQQSCERPPSNALSEQQLRDNRQIFVGDIPKNFDEINLRRIFEKYGQVISVRIIPVETQSQNYGFITFRDERTVQNVLSKKNELVLASGKFLKVKENKHRRNNGGYQKKQSDYMFGKSSGRGGKHVEEAMAFTSSRRSRAETNDALPKSRRSKSSSWRGGGRGRSEFHTSLFSI